MNLSFKPCIVYLTIKKVYNLMYLFSIPVPIVFYVHYGDVNNKLIYYPSTYTCYMMESVEFIMDMKY